MAGQLQRFALEVRQVGVTDGYDETDSWDIDDVGDSRSSTRRPALRVLRLAERRCAKGRGRYVHDLAQRRAGLRRHVRAEPNGNKIAEHRAASDKGKGLIPA